MLNISSNDVNPEEEIKSFTSFSKVGNINFGKSLAVFISVFLLISLIFMFMPWTQNIHASGQLTTTNPEQRQQHINALIDGRIDKWYVREGDLVAKGDTIVKISEIKDAYFDPELINRLQDQIRFMDNSIVNYTDKINALENNISAINQSRQNKLDQVKNKFAQSGFKYISDSAKLIAAENDFQIAERQFDRYQLLLDSGLKSLTDVEGKKLKFRETQAKLNAAKNQLLIAESNILNANIAQTATQNEYQEKLSKALSDKLSAQSMLLDAETKKTKLANQLTNYTTRFDRHVITAPQTGYITKILKFGLGETIKQGEKLLSIVPSEFDYAVAMYVEPMDLPLLEKGQHVRLIFDGWPNIVFSGWPNLSVGTYPGEVFAIDNYISDNGKYRILIREEYGQISWPNQLRIGSGSTGMMLLKNVPVWYEIWRQLNGFPPDYYHAKTDKTEKKK